MLQIQQALAIIATILSVVSALGATAFPAFEPVIAQVQKVLAGLTALVPPTSLAADIADLAVLLTTIKASGKLPAAADAELTKALTVLGKFESTVADYKRGDLAIIDDNFSFEGVPGILCAMSHGGNAAQLHGM